MSGNSAKNSKQERRAAAREQAAQLKRQQEAAEKRQKTIMFSVIGVAVAGLVALAVFIGVGSGSSIPNFDASLPLAQVENVPRHVTSTGGIPIGTDRAAGGPAAPDAPTLGIYLDFMCNACHTFETINYLDIDAMVVAGEVNLVLYPVAILDANTMSAGTSASTRTSSALVWIADQAPESTLAWYEAVFLEGPHEMTGGLSNRQLADIALEVGVAEVVAEGIADGTAVETFGQWVTSFTTETVSDQALWNPALGNFGTPTLTLNGQRSGIDWVTPGGLRAGVISATEWTVDIG